MAKTLSGRSTITLNRAGIFAITVMDGTPHCGVTPNGRVSLKYDLLVRCDLTSLDNKGFLFDQAKIHAWFQNVGLATSSHPVEVSCELFTIELSRQVFARIHKENTKCSIEYLRFSVSPEIPHVNSMDNRAALIFEWVRL